MQAGVPTEGGDSEKERHATPVWGDLPHLVSMSMFPEAGGVPNTVRNLLGNQHRPDGSISGNALNMNVKMHYV